MKAIIKRVGNKTFFEMKLSGEETAALAREMEKNRETKKGFPGWAFFQERGEYMSGTYTLPCEMLMEEDHGFCGPKR